MIFMENVSIIAQLKVKSPKDTYGTITIRGYYNRRPVTSKSTGHRILIDHWDSSTRLVKDCAPNSRLINTVIQKRLQDMQAQLMKKDIAGHRPNRNIVYKAVRGIDDAQDFIGFCLERIRVDYQSKETIRSYKGECTKLQEFRRYISFADLDYVFLAGYKKHMIDKLGNDENTVWKSFKFINTMINKALAIGGIIHENPFNQFDRGKYVQKQRHYLELSDCDKLEEIALNEDQPVLIRRVSIRFLLMCYSGMRYQDAMAFNPDVHVINGERIVMGYQKFNTTVNNILWDRLKGIIELVKLAPLKMGNKQFNQWLKVIAGACKINADLTSHMGRHTLGSLLAEAEVPIEKAQLILGHRDIRSTRIYYHQKAKDIDRGMMQLNTLKATVRIPVKN
jgi:site-specific recombinase XerD